MIEAFMFFLRRENGATVIEYALIAGGIALAVAGFAFTFGEDLRDTYALFAQVPE